MSPQSIKIKIVVSKPTIGSQILDAGCIVKKVFLSNPLKMFAFLAYNGRLYRWLF
jgi:hypothetical protein